MVRPTAAAWFAASVLFLSGCASQPVTVTKRARTPGDPFEAMNRRIYAFNEAFDRALAKPVTTTYRAVTPQFVKTGISNFVSNLSYPAVIVNDALQLKPMPTLRATGRFVMNTTVGVAGFFDPATKIGLEAHNEDLGQTLGRWGLGAGPYLVLPFSNPTTFRDGISRVIDPFSNPLTQAADDSSVKYGIAGMRLLDTGSGKSSGASTLPEPYDPYAVTRSIYWQRRNYLVFDGNVPEEPIDEDFFEEDAPQSFILVGIAMPELSGDGAPAASESFSPAPERVVPLSR